MRLWKSFRVQRRDEISYYDTMGEFEAERFAVNLNQLIAEAMAEKQKAGVIFLCIGTDRSTGDSLGPLVGHKLRKCRLKKSSCDRDVRQTGPCYEPGSLCSLYPYSFSGSCDRGHRCFCGKSGSRWICNIGERRSSTGAGSFQRTDGSRRHFHNRDRGRSRKP